MINKQYLFDFLNLIPRGKVVSYKFLSEIFQSSPRAIAKILSMNQLQSIYPCYKVINCDGKLGGYNMGLLDKISRLEEDGIQINNYYVSQEYFWKPKIHNVFCAIPLVGQSFIDFGKIIKEIKPILSKYKVNLQKISTPHMTLKFWGNIGLDQINNIINTLGHNINGNINIKDEAYIFDDFGDFNKNVFFLTISKLQNQNNIYNFQKIIDKISFLFDDNKPFLPHITLFKTSDKIPLDYQKEIKTIVSKYNININFNKLSFYIAIDNVHQVPIYDLNLLNNILK